MAQTKNTKKSPAAGKSRQTSGSKTAEPVHKRRTYRREIAAGFCLLLGIFSLIGYFSSTGWFIGIFCNLLKGLLGWGFYAIAPLLIICSVILCFHRGRPVRFRVVCTLLLSVAIGALTHLYFNKGDYTLSFPMFKELWSSGVALKSGGALSGSTHRAFYIPVQQDRCVHCLNMLNYFPPACVAQSDDFRNR